MINLIEFICRKLKLLKLKQFVKYLLCHFYMVDICMYPQNVITSQFSQQTRTLFVLIGSIEDQVRQPLEPIFLLTIMESLHFECRGYGSETSDTSQTLALKEAIGQN